MRWIPWTVMAFAVATSGCERREPTAEVPASPEKAAAASVEAEPASDTPRAGGHGRGRGRGKGRLAPVLVDGKPAGVLRYHELPAALATTMHPLDDGSRVQRFTIDGYLRAVGVDPTEVKAVHLHGGRGRVSVISGAELARVGTRLQIAFTRETAGRPTFKYPGVDLRTNTTIDGINAMMVYAETPAPEYRRGKLLVDGRETSARDYLAEHQLRGTRVYLDGKLVGSLARKQLASTLAAAIDALDLPHAPKSAELVVGDDVVLSADAARLSDASLTLSAPSGAQGRVAIAGVAEGEAVDAILLYAQTGPSPRNRSAERASGGKQASAVAYAGGKDNGG